MTISIEYCCCYKRTMKNNPYAVIFPKIYLQSITKITNESVYVMGLC